MLGFAVAVQVCPSVLGVCLVSQAAAALPAPKINTRVCISWAQEDSTSLGTSQSELWDSDRAPSAASVGQLSSVAGACGLAANSCLSDLRVLVSAAPHYTPGKYKT